MDLQRVRHDWVTFTSLHFGNIIGVRAQRWLVLWILIMLFVPCISRLCYCKVETSVVSVMSIPLTVIHFPLTFQICEVFFFFFFFTISLYCYNVWLWLSFHLPCLVYSIFLRSVGLCFSSVLNNFNVLSLLILCVFSIYFF